MEMDWVTGVKGEAGIMEMDQAMGGIYSRDHWVDRLLSQLAMHLVFSHIIILYNTLHTISFPSFDLT